MGKKKRSNLLRRLKQLNQDSSSIAEHREASFRRLENTVTGKGAKVMRSGAGEPSMSAILHQFLKNYTDQPPTLEQYQQMLPFVAVGWNAALLPENEREGTVQRFLEMLRPDYEPIKDYALHKLIQTIIQDKLEHFSKFDRPILNYEVYEAEGELQLSVMSKIVDA